MGCLTSTPPPKKKYTSHNILPCSPYSLGRSREPRDSPILAQTPEEQAEEAFDTPTVSFESFLTYDAPTPTKKKKKPGSSSRPSSHHHTPPRPRVLPSPAAPSSSKESKPSKANGSRSKRADPAQNPTATTPVPEKRRKVRTDLH